MLARQKQAEYRENLIGTDFITCPDKKLIRIFINGQLISAQGFPNCKIFISYVLVLPQGWKQQFGQQFLRKDLTTSEMKQSITQLVTPVSIKNQQGGVTNKFYFSFPIELQLIVDYSSYQQKMPTINFQVFSKDQWDRIYMQGCGFIQLPKDPGHHLIETATWKPQLDNKAKVSEFFLGGVIKPKNIQQISKASKINQMDKSGPINRSLFSTTSSGQITFRLNIATQSNDVKIDERRNYRAIKFSQQTEVKKGQMKSGYTIPPQMNTGTIIGSRFTTTNLN